MKTSRILAWTLASLVVGGSVAYGQTLVDVAREEEARRKSVKAPSRVYTLQDVQKASGADPAAPVSAPQGATAAAAAPAAPAATPPGPAAAAPPDPSKTEPPPKDEAYWRGQVSGARDKLGRSAAYLNALKTQYGVLTDRFLALADGAQRGAVAAEIQKVDAEINRLQQEMGEQTKALADLEEEARRAGVPPGWIRLPDF